MILNSIAIDDEILALNKIKRFISKIDFINLEHTFDNAQDAIEYLNTNTVELIFLDVEMPGINGFQFLQTLNYNPYVIMTTAFEHYALKSYDFSVNDYLLKPLQFDRFSKAVEKIYKLVQQNINVTSGMNNINHEREYIFVKSSGKVVKIATNDILYIEGMKDYIAIHLVNKRVLTLMNFQDILEKLPQEKFMRTHKSFIVNKSKIDQIKTRELIISGESIPVSRTYKPEIIKFKNYLI